MEALLHSTWRTIKALQLLTSMLAFVPLLPTQRAHSQLMVNKQLSM